MTHRGRFKGFRSHFVGPPALVDGVCTPQDCSSLVQLSSPIARLAVTLEFNFTPCLFIELRSLF